VDAIVLFKPLQLAEIEKIVDLLMLDLRRRLVDRQISLEMTARARQFVAREGFDPVYGARPLKRFLQRQLETRLGRAIVAGDIADGSSVVVDEVDGALTLRPG
jgi:ATP-dependent Clp protease ATP-binding subunit ClpB